MLNKIVEKTKERLVEAKRNKPLEELKEEVSKLKVIGDFPFKEALKSDEVSIIAEVKRASPSKGLIAPDFDHVMIAKDYEEAGASAISVLTEPYFFQGSNDYLNEISKEVSIPLLRKDFVIDEYMIYEAKAIGASAVLLICSILDKETLKLYIDLAHSLGLSALVEAHDEDEMKTALDSGAEIIGVNNRNLKDFSVDFNNAIRLRNLAPDNILFVSESGVKTKEDIDLLRDNDVDAVLIGEFLMRSDDKSKMINYLIAKD